jgi:hypothetical protein
MKLNFCRPRLLAVCALFCIVLTTAAFADGYHDRTHFGSNITIGPGEEVGDATCFGCSIRVRGHVNGDVTAFGGSIIIEDQGEVGGDVTTFGGGIRLSKEVQVHGDLTVLGGRMQRDPAARIGGEVTTFGGPGWMLLIFLVPFIVLGLFIALIVWVIRRLFRASVPATA